VPAVQSFPGRRGHRAPSGVPTAPGPPEGLLRLGRSIRGIRAIRGRRFGSRRL